eukprot:COSAG02_NODE_1839_length_10707_cov_7.098793_5_plen_33_part_00
MLREEVVRLRKLNTELLQSQGATQTIGRLKTP